MAVYCCTKGILRKEKNVPLGTGIFLNDCSTFENFILFLEIPVFLKKWFLKLATLGIKSELIL